ncbi:MAG: GntR family transcriptional regulator [Anaerolineae bacterium]|nr:GntR family transcriptional regulator [Anaerolineae bacterium]
MNWQLDSTAAVPLHQQFETRIKTLIEEGVWQPGDQIPSERDLMQQAGISRATVRQALSALVHDGILEKAHGRGTFVRRTRFEQPLTIVYSFSQQLRSLGVTLEDELLERVRLPASPEMARRLAVPVDEPLICLKRLRRVNRVPLMVNIAYLPYALCPALLHEPLEGSLYVHLTTHYNLTIVSATDRLEAVPADSTIARLLAVPRRAPLMYVERTAYAADQAIVHLGYNYLRGDMCRFRSDMQHQPASLEVKTRGTV